MAKKIIPVKFEMMTFGRNFVGTPKVDENFGANDWISFGAKNDFPQELIRLYQNSSGRHSKLIQRKVDMIAGLGFKEVPELEEFMKNQFSKETLDEVAYKAAFDEVIFGGYYLNVIWNKTGDKIAQIEAVPFEKIRCQKPNEETEEVEGFYISKDWLKWRKYENTPEWICRFNPEKAKEYPSQLLQVKIYSPGAEYYPLPNYQSSINWIKLDYEISTFHLKNVQNGLMPGMIIINKTGIPSPEEREAIYNEVKARYTGADNAGDFIMLFGDADKVPEIQPIELNGTDKRFDELKKQINDELMIAHGFTPAVAGIEVSGKLGGRAELEEQLEYLQTTVIYPLQKIINRTFNKFAAINGLPESFELNEYKLFKTPSPSAAAVSTAGPSGTETQAAEPIQVNDNLKNLTGRQHQQLLRIIRQFTTGKLTQEQATIMLRSSLGLNDDDINTLLGIGIDDEEEFKND